MKTEKSYYSAEIKTEILQICEAFNLGKFLSLLSFEESSEVEGYIKTEFKTEKGTFYHWFRRKDIGRLSQTGKRFIGGGYYVYGVYFAEGEEAERDKYLKEEGYFDKECTDWDSLVEYDSSEFYYSEFYQ